MNPFITVSLLLKIDPDALARDAQLGHTPSVSSWRNHNGNDDLLNHDDRQ